jgi:hypothetical protein
LPRYDRPDFWGLPGSARALLLRRRLPAAARPDGRIGGYIPLLGGALAIGNAWPTYYEPVALPSYYESYYGLGPYNSYRYADNVIYRVDPETAAITSVAALLTGDDFVVGQPMPIGYDVVQRALCLSHAVRRPARRAATATATATLPGRSRRPPDRRGDRMLAT